MTEKRQKLIMLCYCIAHWRRPFLANILGQIKSWKITFTKKKERVFDRVSSSGACLSSNPSNKTFEIHRVWSRYTYSYWKLPYRYTPNGLVHMCVKRIQFQLLQVHKFSVCRTEFQTPPRMGQYCLYWYTLKHIWKVKGTLWGAAG